MFQEASKHYTLWWHAHIRVVAVCTEPTLQWRELQRRQAPAWRNITGSILRSSGKLHIQTPLTATTLLLTCTFCYVFKTPGKDYHTLGCSEQCSLTMCHNARQVRWSRVGINSQSSVCAHMCAPVCSGEGRTRNRSGGGSLTFPFFFIWCSIQRETIKLVNL